MRGGLGQGFALSEADVERVVDWLRKNGEPLRTPPAVDVSWWPVELVPLLLQYGPEQVTRAVIAAMKEVQ
ncbi:hypothetical protein MN1_520 [Thermus phage MN1]|nr:hypothetical protein MN1_520 [Thermus phage MN1]